jgi:hypothetical protein
VPLAGARSGQRERVFMITGIGVHDRTDWPFTITGMRIPKDLPPCSTRWGYDGTLEKIHYVLYLKCREQAAREASPSACIVDSQSVKSAEKGGMHRSTWI